MKLLLGFPVLATLLSGCVAVPAYEPVYVAPPPVMVVRPAYRGHYHHHRHHRHFRTYR